MDRTLVGSATQALRRGSGILVAAFALSFVVNMLRLTGPLFMILIYDRVLPARSEETLVALFVMVCTFLLAQGIVDYGRKRILARFGAQFQERLEVSLLARAGQGDLFDQGRTKPVQGLDEVDGLRAFFHSSSLISIYDFFWTPMFLLVVFILDPLMGWVCMGGMALILVLVLIRMLLIGNRENEADSASRNIGELRTMIAASRETVRTQTMARGFKDRWLSARQESRDKAIALKDWTVWFDSLCDVTVLFTRYGVLATGAYLTLEGQLTIGAMVAATFLVTRVLGPVESFLTELPQIVQAWGNWDRLKKVINARLAESAETPAEEPGNPRARLSMVNVAVRSPRTGEQILRSINLDLPAGQMVQITGGTGKGKTVLAETIMGLWRRSGGTILINGQNIARQPDAEIERLFGYIPETPGFVAGSIAENIAHLDPGADPAAVAAAARRACMHAIISAMPDGYQTQIDAGGLTLSRGQRAQLALARAVYRMPQILIIDDMDPMLMDMIPKTIEKTFDTLMEAGCTIILLSRKPLVWRQISATWQLDDGRLRAVKAAANSPARITVVAGKDGKAAADKAIAAKAPAAKPPGSAKSGAAKPGAEASAGGPVTKRVG
jgi:ABC-type protease/lipase transport system fused ATPase/permease subunit